MNNCEVVTVRASPVRTSPVDLVVEDRLQVPALIVHPYFILTVDVFNIGIH